MSGDTSERSGEGSLPGDRESLWLASTPETRYPPLDAGLAVDVVVVGGGIVGVTAAERLVADGRSVAVVERDRIVTGVTGHTTAKLTAQHGLVYDWLERRFGRERAAAYADANQSAVEHVAAQAASLDRDCGFERTPAYTYLPAGGDESRLDREVRAARSAGLPASLDPDVPVPWDAGPGVRFDDQAVFHPRAYLLALADRVAAADGGHVFERTAARSLDSAGGRRRVVTDRGAVYGDSVVVATHFPFEDPAGYFARLVPKQSHVVALELDAGPPEGTFYRASDPYFSVRPVPAADGPDVLVGGQSHRTGDGGSTTGRFRRLLAAARDRFDVREVHSRWTTQDFASVDRVPVVGRLRPGGGDVFVASGFGGWGMSNGTAAGILLADLAVGRDSEWASVFDPTRATLRASASRFAGHNARAGKQYVTDLVSERQDTDPAALAPGEAAVTTVDGERVAAYRDGDGDIHAVSAVCTHLDCVVSWNDAAETWDCPCHGSRFECDGEVVDGPAVDDLPERDVE